MFKNLKFNKNFIYLFFGISCLCFFLNDFTGEGDIWFLLSHGKYVLNHGFPHTDILSMHTEFKFIMQQWLSSVIFYSIYNYLGKMCFYLFIFFLNCVITFLIYKLCLVINGNRKFSACFISVITIVLLQISFIVPRPQIFSYIILILLLLILELYSSKRKKVIYYMPILSLFLINFHASMWPIMFIFCMPYVAEMIIKKDKRVLLLFFMMIISVLVGLINPYGLDAMTYSLKCYGYKYICYIVSEMKSFNLLGNPFVGYHSFSTLGIFLISNLIVLVYSNKKNTSVAHLLLFYGTFFMALLSIRNIALFIIGTVPFLSKYICFKDIDEFKLNKEWIINYIVLFVLFMGSFSFAMINKKYEFKFGRMGYDVILYLDKNANKDVKLYTDYSDGSYFEYYGYKPYIDTRAEVFMKEINGCEDILEEFVKFNIDEKARDKFIKKYDFDYYAINDKNTNLLNYLLNYEDIKFDLVLISKDTYLLKKVS